MLDNDAAVDQRLVVMPNVRRESLLELTRMMSEINPFANQLKAGRDLLVEGDEAMTIGLRGLESTELSKRYAAPTSNEVISVTPGDGDLPLGPRELVIQMTDGRALQFVNFSFEAIVAENCLFEGLRRISEFCAWYDALARPLLNAFGEAGWYIDMRTVRSTKRGLPDCGPARKVLTASMCCVGDVSRVLRVHALRAPVLDHDVDPASLSPVVSTSGRRRRGPHDAHTEQVPRGQPGHVPHDHAAWCLT